MAGTVTAVPGERRIAGEGWTLRTERVEVAAAGAGSAAIGDRA
jgi:hypothetical protein